MTADGRNVVAFPTPATREEGKPAVLNPDDVIDADIARQVEQLQRDAPGTRVTLVKKTPTGALGFVFAGYEDAEPVLMEFVYGPVRERRHPR
jgi:hypothetical protein